MVNSFATSRFISHTKQHDRQNTPPLKSISKSTRHRNETSINLQAQKSFSRSSMTALMYLSPQIFLTIGHPNTIFHQTSKIHVRLHRKFRDMVYHASTINLPNICDPTISRRESTDQSLSGQKVTITGSIPDFQDNMIRQRISTHGEIRAMEPPSDMPALKMSPGRNLCAPPGSHETLAHNSTKMGCAVR